MPAMIDNIDQNIGRLLTFLKEEGQLENTLILFLADNCGCASANAAATASTPCPTIS